MIRTSQKLGHLAVLTIIALIAFTGIYSARGLYSDGSFWLFEILTKQGFYIFDQQRAYAQYVVEWPVVLAIKSGVMDLNVLIRLHSAGFILAPLFFWLSALLVQRSSYVFWLIVLGFSVSYLRSGFFAAGEFNLTNGMVALCVAITLSRTINIFSALALILTADILTHSYESMSFLGLFLVLISVERLVFIKTDSFFTKAVFAIVAALYFYGSFIAIRSMLFERVYSLQSTVNLNAFAEFHLAYLLIMCAVATCLCLRLSQRIKVIFVVVGVVLTCIYVVYVLRFDRTGISYGYFSYAYRSHGAFMLVGVLSLAWLIPIFEKLQKIQFVKVQKSLLVIVVMCVFFTESGLMLGHSVGFYRWLKSFESVALTVKGLIPIDKTTINKGEGWVTGYNWPWSNSTLSVLLRGNATGIVTNASDFTGWETFDPKEINPYPLTPFLKSGPL